MAYGTYDKFIGDLSNDDSALATAIILEAAVGAKLTKTVVDPLSVTRFGFRPTVAFNYDTLTTKGVLGLYKYLQGLVCMDLPTALTMCNLLVRTMNAHAVDDDIHAAIDDVNFPVDEAPAVNLASLLTKVNLLQTAYAAHNVDANLASAWVFHRAQVNHALANATPSTTLALAIAKLNDMVAKYNLHDLSAVTHYYGDRHSAMRIELATINLEEGDQVGVTYYVNVDNKVQKAVGPASGVASLGVADFQPGDQVVIEVKTAAVGGTEVGDFQPLFWWHPRAEAHYTMDMAVDRTPVKTPVNAPY